MIEKILLILLLLCWLIFFFYYYTSTLEFELDEFYEYVSREEYLNSKEYLNSEKYKNFQIPFQKNIDSLIITLLIVRLILNIKVIKEQRWFLIMILKMVGII